MSKAIRASVFVLLLACPAYAGDIQNDSPAPPPPPAAASADGLIQDEPPPPDDSDEAPAVNGYRRDDVAGALSQTALLVLDGVLALF